MSDTLRLVLINLLAIYVTNFLLGIGIYFAAAVKASSICFRVIEKYPDSYDPINKRPGQVVFHMIPRLIPAAGVFLIPGYQVILVLEYMNHFKEIAESISILALSAIAKNNKK